MIFNINSTRGHTGSLLVIILYDTLNTKNNEFNSAAIFPIWHELPRLICSQINVADGRKLENITV